MRNHRIGSRPHVQGASAPLRLRHSAQNLTDGGGLVVLRRLWDGWDLGTWIDRRSRTLGGYFRPSLMVELWVVLLLYGGRVLDDLRLIERRGVRRLFGWVRVPDPTSFGRWLRRAAEPLVPLLDELLWHVVRRRWAMVGGAPEALTLVLDSTVVLRYGEKQAGAEWGYNPKEPGRPSHHPLLAFVQETGAWVRYGGPATPTPRRAQVRGLASSWAGSEPSGSATSRYGSTRASSARPSSGRSKNSASGICSRCPRMAGSRTIKARGGSPPKARRSSRAMSCARPPARFGAPGFSRSRPESPLEGADTLALDTYETGPTAHVLTNIEGIHALTSGATLCSGAWARSPTSCCIRSVPWP